MRMLGPPDQEYDDRAYEPLPLVEEYDTPGWGFLLGIVVVAIGVAAIVYSVLMFASTG